MLQKNKIFKKSGDGSKVEKTKQKEGSPKKYKKHKNPVCTKKNRARLETSYKLSVSGSCVTSIANVTEVDSI